MKRRSKSFGEQIKGRRRKTPGPKPRNAPKAVSRSIAPPTQEQTEISRLARELKEAMKQRTATSEVLRMLSGSHTDVDRLFQTILANATNLCRAHFGTLLLREGDAFRMVATHNVPPAFADFRRREPLIRAPPLLRMAETKRLLHVADVREYAASRPLDRDTTAFAELSGVRTLIAVPMLKDGDVIGAIVAYRKEVRAFADSQIELIKDFAAQAVIAIENARLLNELRQRTTDLTEALEQQTATSDVLQVISSSPGDLQPVFATMLQNAVRICDAGFGNIYRVEGDGLRIAATHNTPPAFAEARKSSPYLTPGPKSPLRRMMTTKAVVLVLDNAATEAYAEHDPGSVAAVELGGARTVLYVPMLKETEPIGALTLSRQKVRPFTDKQIELVQNFAAQAVIAIENARLLNELRQRTTDLTEALEQQTATSQVLQVISTSPGDLEPVFGTMLEKAVRICDASFGNIFRWDGQFLNHIAAHNTPVAFLELRRHQRISFGPEDPVGRTVTNRSVVHTADLAEERGYIERSNPGIVAAVEFGGIRTHVVVPMLKDDELIGTFTCPARRFDLLLTSRLNW
jgi:GAF domain-containing protein